MADIKGLDIFGNNRGLERIKKEVEEKKAEQTDFRFKNSGQYRDFLDFKKETSGFEDRKKDV